MCFSNLKKTQFDIPDVRWVYMSGSRILLQAIINNQTMYKLRIQSYVTTSLKARTDWVGFIGLSTHELKFGVRVCNINFDGIYM